MLWKSRVFGLNDYSLILWLEWLFSQLWVERVFRIYRDLLVYFDEW